MKQLSKYEIMYHLKAELAHMYSEEYGDAMYVAVGNHPHWDLSTAAGETTIIVKCECTSAFKDFVSIEVFNGIEAFPFGIEDIEADMWLHLLLTPEGILAVEYSLDDLKKVINEYGEKIVCYDKSVSMFVPIDSFKRHCKRMFYFESALFDELTALSNEEPITNNP